MTYSGEPWLYPDDDYEDADTSADLLSLADWQETEAAHVEESDR